MAFEVLSAVWRARTLDGRALRASAKLVLVRLADEVRLPIDQSGRRMVEKGVVSISLKQLAADCGLSKVGAHKILQRLVVRFTCAVHAAKATPEPNTAGACPVCGAALVQTGCVEVVLPGSGTRATRYRILLNRLGVQPGGQLGLPQRTDAARGQPRTASGKPRQHSGHAGLPIPDLPDLPGEDRARPRATRPPQVNKRAMKLPTAGLSPGRTGAAPDDKYAGIVNRGGARHVG
jgi:hypothetical protein